MNGPPELLSCAIFKVANKGLELEMYGVVVVGVWTVEWQYLFANYTLNELIHSHVGNQFFIDRYQGVSDIDRVRSRSGPVRADVRNKVWWVIQNCQANPTRLA